MSATQSGSTKIRELISTANEVCNLIRQQQGQSSKLLGNVLHMTDVTGCLPKLYLDRGYDPAGVCYQLVKMFQGKLLENASVKRFCDLGYEHEPVYGGLLGPGSMLGRKGTVGRPTKVPIWAATSVADFPVPTLAVHATPDFIYPASIVGGKSQPPEILLEMAVIGYAVPVAHYIAMRQARFLQDLGGIGGPYEIPMPPMKDPQGADNYPDDPVNFPQFLFFNHLLQLSAYRAAVSRDKMPLITRFLAIYTNAEHEYTFTQTHLDKYYPYFEERLAPAAYAMTRGTVQTGVKPEVKGKKGRGNVTEPETIVQRAVARQGYDEPTFTRLYFYELHTPGILLASIQCPTCPYYSMRICPGIPPIRTPYAEFQDKERLMQFLNVGTKGWVTSPRLTPAEVETIMDPSLKGSDRRLAYLDWLKAVLMAVPVPPAFRPSDVNWTGLVTVGTCDLQSLAGLMPAFSPAGQTERAVSPPK